MPGQKERDCRSCVVVGTPIGVKLVVALDGKASVTVELHFQGDELVFTLRMSHTDCKFESVVINLLKNQSLENTSATIVIELNEALVNVRLKNTLPSLLVTVSTMLLSTYC